MKKLHVAYLMDVSKNCYPEKWMNEDMPNEPQVNLCRHEKYDKHFGKLNNEIRLTRDSNSFHLSDCLKAADTDGLKASKCLKKYVERIEVDNANLLTFVKANYAKYY